MIQPFVIGSGRSAQALAKSLALSRVIHPQIRVKDPVFLKRGDFAALQTAGPERKILLVANPHALHADWIEAAARADFAGVITEKPACVSLTEVERLEKLSLPVAVLHGYRRMWGPVEMQKRLSQAQLGKVISIEGRYWQASAAERALVASPAGPPNWKNDASLSGPSDVLLDLATHWVDLMHFLMGAEAQATLVWKSHVNAEAAHRDTHVHVLQEYASGERSFGSVSKTVHGAGNDLEIHVLGEQGRLAWNFQDADRLWMGQGRELQSLSRRTTELGLGQGAFHGAGWLEGYQEIVQSFLLERMDLPHEPYPTLKESLRTVRQLLEAKAL